MKRQTTFSDKMMLVVAIPLVLMWISVAVYVIFMGINDETGRVQENLDYFTTLIGILGGPALLFISAILEAWKGEQSAELNALPDRLQAETQASVAKAAHEMLIHRLHHEHDIQMDAFKTTGSAKSEVVDKNKKKKE